MKRKIITAASVCILVLVALVAKSESLLSANAKVIIQSIPVWVTCYNILDQYNSTVAPYKEYRCSDCTQYRAIRREDDDTCSTAWAD